MVRVRLKVGKGIVITKVIFECGDVGLKHDYLPMKKHIVWGF
jgi:hypothetical protein